MEQTTRKNVQSNDNNGNVVRKKKKQKTGSPMRSSSAYLGGSPILTSSEPETFPCTLIPTSLRIILTHFNPTPPYILSTYTSTVLYPLNLKFGSNVIQSNSTYPVILINIIKPPRSPRNWYIVHISLKHKLYNDVRVWSPPDYDLPIRVPLYPERMELVPGAIIGLSDENKYFYTLWYSSQEDDEEKNIIRLMDIVENTRKNSIQIVL